MRFLSTAFFIVALVMLLPPARLRAGTPTGKEVLESLRGWDAIFGHGIDVEGEVELPPSPFDPTSLARVVDMRFTTWGENFAIQQTFVRRVPNTAQSAVVIGNPAEGSESVPLRRVYVFENGSSRSFESLATEYTESGEPVVDAGTREMVLLYNPDNDNAIRIAKNQIWFSLGRGYSDHLDAITETERDEEGLLVARGLGRFRPGESGRWELKIDESAGMLVRTASFFVGDPEMRVFTTTTAGMLTTGDFLVAQEGNFCLRITDQYDLCTKYRHRVLRGEPDREFFRQCKYVFDAPLKRDSIVHDNRSGKEQVTIVGANQPKSPAAVPILQNRVLLIVVNLVALSAIFCLLAVRAMSRRPGP